MNLSIGAEKGHLDISTAINTSLRPVSIFGGFRTGITLPPTDVGDSSVQVK